MTASDEYLRVKNMLTNYKDKEKMVKIFGTNIEEQCFLAHCLNCLEVYERDLITNIMIEKISVRCYSRKSGFSRNFITKERDRIILLIAKFFEIKESYHKYQEYAG